MSTDRPDSRDSAYMEDFSMRGEFSSEEREQCLALLRRLRFLERQVKKNGGVGAAKTPSDHFTEREFKALEWALFDIGFVKKREGNSQ